MTTSNDLREALARVVSDQRRDADVIVNDIHALAATPEYRLAILDAMGLDVTEGESNGRTVSKPVPRDIVIRGNDGVLRISPMPRTGVQFPKGRVLVVRPRGGSDG